MRLENTLRRIAFLLTFYKSDLHQGLFVQSIELGNVKNNDIVGIANTMAQ